MNNQKELECLIADQESEISRLNSLLAVEDESSDIALIENSLQKEVKRLEKDAIRHLNNFTEFCPIVGLSDVQSHLKIDEEINNLLVNYAKSIDQAIDAIDSSVYQQCLRSERAQEFADLCTEKKRLEIFALNCMKQKILAKGAYDKYKVAMKSFEDILIKEDTLRKLENISKLTEENNKEIADLNLKINACLDSIDQITHEIDDINVELIEFTDIDLLMKKDEFRKSKMQEMIKLIEFQKKQSLLGLSSIVLEQEEVQQEYDRLFQIQSLFEDLNAQIEFRIGAYKNFKNRAELLSEERNTIDERDLLFTRLHKDLVTTSDSSIITFQQLLTTIEKNAKANSELQRKDQDALDRIIEDYKLQVNVCKGGLEIIHIHNNPEEIARETSYLSHEITKLESKLQSSSEKFESMNKSIITSQSGISEREIFIQYLVSPSPEFFKECDNI